MSSLNSESTLGYFCRRIVRATNLDGLAGINELPNAESGIQMYPNPTSNNITIHYESVYVETGNVNENQGSPDGFAQVHYDHQPSSLSYTQIEKDFQSVDSGNQFDLDDSRQKQSRFENNFFNKQLQTQQRQQQSNVTFNSLRRNGFNSTDFKNKQRIVNMQARQPFILSLPPSGWGA